MSGVPNFHHVHCDESQTSGARFVVYGGIIITAGSVGAFDEVMQEWRGRHRMTRELKWTKVSNGKYKEYASLVDLFFEHVSSKFMHFKSIVFDTQDPFYRSERRDKEVGFYKLYYQFLLHKFGPYAFDDEHQMHVLIDERTTKYNKLEVLQIILNRGIRRKYGRSADVVKLVEPRDSKKCNLLQVADVIMGAIGYHANDLHRVRGAAKAKISLADYVAKKARLPRSLKQNTAPKRVDFEIWLWKPKEKRPGT